MRKAVAAIAICLFAGTLAVAQSPMAPPGAGARAQSATTGDGIFRRPWKITGTTKISPDSPAVPYTATATGEWIPGNYFLEIKYVTHGPLGDIHMVRMMEYNAPTGFTPTTSTTAWANM